MDDTDRLQTLVRKGYREPGKVPGYLLGRLFPGSRWGPGWVREDGYITFREDSLTGGSPSRPEFSARVYHEATQIERLLDGREYDRALEIGCGYGRLVGWVASHADEAAAIEPNAEALAAARRAYPEVDFEVALADDIPYPDDHFDLVVAWAVLGHIPPGTIERAAREIRRVLRDDGTLLLCERTSGDSASGVWVRSRGDYEALFDPFAVVAAEERAAEPSFEYARYMETMRLDAPRS
ncbi:class I SAM-dependent methyltransferase [Halomarina ordinaria]|uniref:Class I SAM-dependent methyltransferase n=1 Tax=Halomarina ordinaria TaxID=3033939 RepID=A0ABD5U6N0_9EURY|nr:class I SAM-dependent methyltransferase [Halomarina sp. PSRA2]